MASVHDLVGGEIGDGSREARRPHRRVARAAFDPLREHAGLRLEVSDQAGGAAHGIAVRAHEQPHHVQHARVAGPPRPVDDGSSRGHVGDEVAHALVAYGDVRREAEQRVLAVQLHGVAIAEDPRRHQQGVALGVVRQRRAYLGLAAGQDRDDRPPLGLGERPFDERAALRPRLARRGPPP